MCNHRNDNMERKREDEWTQAGCSDHFDTGACDSSPFTATTRVKAPHNDEGRYQRIQSIEPCETHIDEML